MLVKDVMTKNVITVSSRTTATEAQRILKEHNFRRLPVVDEGRLVGMVTQDRLERVKPKTSAPLLWQITYIISHTSVGDVMRKKVVTVKPGDTVEHAVAKAQSSKVGTLVVIEKGKIVGICTTNDFFYKIVNPTLGLCETGARILVSGDDIVKITQNILSCIDRLGIEIKVLWAIPSNTANQKDVIIHLDTEETSDVISGLEGLGCKASLVAR